MRVGFDLDGVLYDFGGSVQRYLRSIGRDFQWKDNGHEPHTWNFFEDWGMDAAEFVQLCHDGADAGYIFCGETRPGAAAAVEEVARMGHEIIIITDRTFGTTPAVSERNTTEWLAQHGIEYDELIFSPNKCCVPTDMFVEDKLENYDNLILSGVDAYLINRKWNVIPGGDTRKRINDISDYVEQVRRVTEQGFADLTIS